MMLIWTPENILFLLYENHFHIFIIIIILYYIIIIVIIIIILYYIIILNIISSVCLCVWNPGKWFEIEISFLIALNNSRHNL